MRGRRPRKYLHDAIRALQFALLGNVDADGSAQGASKFGPGKKRRVQEEFAPIGSCFVEKVSHFLDDVGKEHIWLTGLFKSQKGGKSLAPLLPQTPPCPSSGMRELAERITFCNTMVPFCDHHAIDITAKWFR